MSDRRPPRAARAGLLATTLAAGLAAGAVALGAPATAAAPSPGTAATSASLRVPTGACPADLVQHVDQVPDVVVGTVGAVDESSPEADVRDVTLVDVRPLAGSVEGGGEMLVKTMGVPDGTFPKPAVGAAYVVFVTPSNDEGGTAAFGARLCDYVAGAQQAKVQEAIAQAEAGATPEAPATEVTWTDVDEADGRVEYGEAVLPGGLIAAIGAFGLAGTVLLSAVAGRRH